MHSGKIDHEYLEYVVKVLRKIKEWGFYVSLRCNPISRPPSSMSYLQVFMDPHQDIVGLCSCNIAFLLTHTLRDLSVVKIRRRVRRPSLDDPCMWNAAAQLHGHESSIYPE
jgi:hypothetical protein